jgi:drug/metabolite transporter (DMT)-like permease
MRFPNPHLYAWSAFFCFGLLTSCIKGLHGTIPLALIIGARSAIGIICLWPLIHQQGGLRRTLKATRYPSLQFLRALIGLIALSLSFYAIPRLQLADANGLGQIYPVLLTVLAPFILQEQAGLKQWGALGIGLSGALIIAQPNGHDMSLIPILCVLGSAFTAAVGDLIVRYMGRHDHSLTITIWFFTLTAIIALGWWMFYDQPKPITIRQSGLLLGVGIAGAAAQYFMVQAFKFLPAATMGVYSSLGLMWAVLFGWLFFNEFPDWGLWVGGALILLAARIASYTSPKRAPVAG